jgi:competence protein ComEA
MDAIRESRTRMLAYTAAGVLLVIAGVRYLDDGGEPPPPPVAVDDAAGEPGGQAGGGGAKVYVHVAGAVQDQGLLRLPEGARVGAAIHRAGGPTPGADLSGVNLAAEVQDGQQVLVPKRGTAPAPTASGATPTAPTSTAPASTTGAPAAPVSLAQATPEQIDAAVDGIGPVLAARIIEYRDENGNVESIDELAQVDGIGETRIVDLREALVP